MKKVILTIDKAMKKQGLNQKELAELSGLREATVSMLVRNKYDRVQLAHLEAIADALDINDISELMTIVDDKQKGDS
ncbi:helix-turn-helix domain-containing protein [Bacillus smithii]|jgi:DNA-binding Xre family transcriptional regulator|uniref:helix-turn-helix domain-containing protein n=1 Tax=Bacillus smithii TaxID=1479 RepID=UPI003D1A93B7